jgi:hypothetical protein
MTRFDIATLACRILAVVFVAVALVTTSKVLTIVIVQYGQGRLLDNVFYGLPAVLGGAVWGFASFICWRYATSLAQWMVDDEDDEDDADEPVTQLGLTAEQILALGCSLTGLFVVIAAVRTLMAIVVRFLLYKNSLDEWWADVEWRAGLVAAGIEFALGLWLVLGAQGFAAIIHWARTAKARTPSDSAEEQSP